MFLGRGPKSIFTEKFYVFGPGTQVEFYRKNIKKFYVFGPGTQVDFYRKILCFWAGDPSRILPKKIKKFYVFGPGTQVDFYRKKKFYVFGPGTQVDFYLKKMKNSMFLGRGPKSIFT